MKKSIVTRAVSFAIAGAMMATPLAAMAETMEVQQTHSFLNQETQTINGEHNVATTSYQQRSYTVPAGTSLRVQTIGMVPDQYGETFTGQLLNPVSVNGVNILPAGSRVTGDVVAVNNNNTVNVRFRNVSTPSGQSFPISSQIAMNSMTNIQGNVETNTVNGAATTTTTRDGWTLYPRATWGPSEGMTPGGKIVAGTIGGAAFGGLTGALSGLVMPSIYEDDINMNEGTSTVRGLAWGAAMGAGVGLIGGLIGAAADRDRVSYTTTTTRPVAMNRGITNITTGSLEEIPVAYGTANTEFNIVLDQPLTVTY